MLACSALKQTYRDRLAGGVEGVQLVLLTGSRELLAERAAARTHRYMPPSLLDSQLATLEPLEPGSGWEIDVTRAGRRDRRRPGAATGRRDCRRGYSPASLRDSDHAPPERKASEVASGGP